MKTSLLSLLFLTPNFVALAQTLPISASATVPPSGWVSIISQNSGLCLDVPTWSGSNWGNTPGLILQQWTCNGGDMQQWQFTPVNGGYQIINKLSGQSIDVLGGPSALSNGNPVGQWPYWGGTNEIWRIVSNDDGTYFLTAVNSGKSLDVTGLSTAPGGLLEQWDYWGGMNQKWIIQTSGGNPPSPAPTPNPTGLTPPAAVPNYHLAWNDEFNSLNLSPTGSGAYNWYKSYWWDPYIPPAQNITVSNGILNLQWTQGQGGPDTSISTFAHDTSAGSSFRYGYFEARMKWDVVNGAWPAFWALPIQAAQGQQHTGELDFFEGQGSDPHTFFGTAHEWQGSTSLWTNSPNYYPVGSNTDFSQWHTYGALWQPGMISWYLDGQLLHSTNLPLIFDQQNYFLVLGMQEGANWSLGSLSGVSAVQINLQVDYVRVWQP